MTFADCMFVVNQNRITEIGEPSRLSGRFYGGEQNREPDAQSEGDLELSGTWSPSLRASGSHAPLQPYARYSTNPAAHAARLAGFTTERIVRACRGRLFDFSRDGTATRRRCPDKWPM